MNNNKDETLFMLAYCKNCNRDFKITKDMLFSAGDLSAYATNCPNCGFFKKLPFRDVIKNFKIGNYK